MRHLREFEESNANNPWDELVLGNIYNVYDTENNGKVVLQNAEFMGEEDGKLVFKSIFLPKADPRIIDKDPKYSFTKKAKPHK